MKPDPRATGSSPTKIEAAAMALAVLESPMRSRCWACVPEDWEEHDADERPTRAWFREQARAALEAASDV